MHSNVSRPEDGWCIRLALWKSRENEEVVERIAAETGYRIEERRYRIPGKDSGDGFFACVLRDGGGPKVY